MLKKLFHDSWRNKYVAPRAKVIPFMAECEVLNTVSPVTSNPEGWDVDDSDFEW